MKMTMEQIKDAESQLKPCPFCGRSVEIVICDDEGNPKKDPDYLEDPWRGLSFMVTHDNDQCLLHCDKDEDQCIGQYRFSRLTSLVNTWNYRPVQNVVGAE